MTATAVDRVTPRWPWIVLPAAGSLWAALALRRSYFFYDEWSMIDRVMHLSAGEGTFASFNGHLWMLQYWLYRTQVSWFGVDDHIFVSVVFVVSLLALHLAITWVLRAAGTPLVTSLLVGGLLTYLGVASQNFIFAVQTSSTLAMAVCLAAAAIVLTRPPSIPSATAAAILLVLAVGLDSGMALTGLVFATVVVVRTWRSRWALVALPSILAIIWWYLAGDLGPHFPATFGEKASFALHLGLTSIGGLVGQGEIAGAIIAVLSGGAITVGLRRRWITGATATVLLAGTVAAAVVTAGLARSRGCGGNGLRQLQPIPAERRSAGDHRGRARRGRRLPRGIEVLVMVDSETSGRAHRTDSRRDRLHARRCTDAVVFGRLSLLEPGCASGSRSRGGDHSRRLSARCGARSRERGARRSQPSGDDTAPSRSDRARRAARGERRGSVGRCHLSNVPDERRRG